MADVGALDFFPSPIAGRIRAKTMKTISGCILNSQVMTGSYHDMLGEGLGLNIPYTVTLCVWYERKEEQA
jgi:hypothetical protein